MSLKHPKFTPGELSIRINEYFNYIKGDSHKKKVPAKDATSKPTYTKIWDRDPEPATITGLALYLGFNSIQSYHECEHKGRFSEILKRGRLRVLVEYEKRLHQHSTSGAIFAIKNLLGWDETKTTETSVSLPLNINITVTGPKLAASEKEVILDE